MKNPPIHINVRSLDITDNALLSLAFIHHPTSAHFSWDQLVISVSLQPLYRETHRNHAKQE
jgi:hypothetical protein